MRVLLISSSIVWLIGIIFLALARQRSGDRARCSRLVCANGSWRKHRRSMWRCDLRPDLDQLVDAPRSAAIRNRRN